MRAVLGAGTEQGHLRGVVPGLQRQVRLERERVKVNKLECEKNDLFWGEQRFLFVSTFEQSSP